MAALPVGRRPLLVVHRRRALIDGDRCRMHAYSVRGAHAMQSYELSNLRFA
jgi:hypothetical protein